MEVSPLQIKDGIDTLVDRFVPRFEVFFAKPAPFTEPGAGPAEPPRDPVQALADEKERLDGLIFLASGAPGAPPPTLSQLLPLAGPWGDKKDQHTDDIISLEFTESIEKNQLAQLRIEVLNVYDFQRKFYRYTDIPPNLCVDKTGVFPLLDYGDTLAIRLGYGANLDWVFDGIVEKLEVDFPADGEPKLSITAVDRRQLLRSKKKLKKSSFGGASEELVVAQIAQEVGLAVAAPEGQLTKSPKGVKKNKPKDQDALQYITDRANKANLELLCFGKTIFVFQPADKAASALRYEYRRGLLSFKPTFNGAGKPTRVRVESRNPTTGETFKVEVGTETLAAEGLIPPSPEGTATDKITKSGQAGDRVEVVTTFLAQTADDAKRIAIGILKKNLDQTLTVTGNVLGDPRIRARETLRIDGVGRFDGFYYVTSATHRIGSNGYQTQFNARRNSALNERGAAPTCRTS